MPRTLTARRRHFRLAELARLALLALLVTAGGACADDSYLVVTLKSLDTPFENVRLVRVRVRSLNGQQQATPEYDRTKEMKEPIAFDATTGKTFSLSFKPERSGEVEITVNVFDGTACIGEASMVRATIKQESVNTVTALVRHTSTCMLVTGCSPTVPMSCATGETCVVNCELNAGMCVMGGMRGPGEACNGNGDCMPGTQCFEFPSNATTGCTGTKVCLKFCDNDAGCPAPVLSRCLNPVLCGGGAATTYKTCSFACDPRGAATTGCPAGLTCFLYQTPSGGEDSPDCGCREPTRTGTDGAVCTGSTNCAPGHVCNTMGTTRVCRRLCRMDSAAADCPTGTCMALTNNTTYGVCIPP
jgi:hypothetical protein